MTEEKARKIIDEEAKFQKQAELLFCPRCGENPLNPVLTRNALSRVNNETFICDTCGTAEALEDVFLKHRKKLSDWDCVRKTEENK